MSTEIIVVENGTESFLRASNVVLVTQCSNALMIGDHGRVRRAFVALLFCPQISDGRSCRASRRHPIDIPSHCVYETTIIHELKSFKY